MADTEMLRKQKGNRLNKVLTGFSMKSQEAWSSGGDHIGPSFSRWTIFRKPKNIWQVIPVMLEQYVGCISKDFTVFGVNPDGPLGLEDCKSIAEAIGTEFGTKVELIMQMSSQGGR